ncbi:MAG: hypothetical protein INR68_19800, partial [Methylobacterium mesophilicum]|nr:hypothetical protein [Methylobacterium mesophilicum]
GDLLFSLVNYGRHLGIDPEKALRATNDKFRFRFGHVERGVEGKGGTLGAATLDEMEALWKEAKTASPAGADQTAVERRVSTAQAPGPAKNR